MSSEKPAGGLAVVDRARQIRTPVRPDKSDVKAAYDALRRCRAITRGGRRCRAWARWADPYGRCASHSVHHRGPMPPRADWTPKRTRGTPRCTCSGLPRQHSPSLCSWPLVPGWEHDPYGVLAGGALG